MPLINCTEPSYALANGKYYIRIYLQLTDRDWAFGTHVGCLTILSYDYPRINEMLTEGRFWVLILISSTQIKKGSCDTTTEKITV